ncbi:BTAD domain-containing putative transcriptional regulator [Spongiactinospora sp. TRM90649]|uniref:AfsR/SARP family transcriptional regulator n=1 Tax=Spongiactinospora sp. TRM90649 TaxID=3031114 RepID=UPI0023F90BCD|nr:BTAD domain-containing putative transcriptional regulator [Spongiactinospora sp. TRM90649]MDF5755775.1 BTAD domain-containing putative transcriptional regulator [Spongiactinospora sp. TRM90649]
MRFRLLSEVDAHREGVWVHLGDRKQRLLLAVLLLAEARPVSIDELIGSLWDDEPIKSARKVIHHYASDLRRHLGKTGSGTFLLPEGKGGLYRVLAGRDEVDVHRFRDQAREGRSLLHRDDERAVRALRAALREWLPPRAREWDSGRAPVGDPLTGLTGRWAAAERRSLLAEHRATLISCLGAELRLGLHEQLIPELGELADAEAPDEQITGLLMLAYHRAGLREDALAAFSAYRARLADATGAGPGPELEGLRGRIIRQDPDLLLERDSAGFIEMSADSPQGITYPVG